MAVVINIQHYLQCGYYPIRSRVTLPASKYKNFFAFLLCSLVN